MTSNRDVILSERDRERAKLKKCQVEIWDINQMLNEKGTESSNITIRLDQLEETLREIDEEEKNEFLKILEGRQRKELLEYMRDSIVDKLSKLDGENNWDGNVEGNPNMNGDGEEEEDDDDDDEEEVGNRHGVGDENGHENGHGNGVGVGNGVGNGVGERDNSPNAHHSSNNNDRTQAGSSLLSSTPHSKRARKDVGLSEKDEMEFLEILKSPTDPNLLTASTDTFDSRSL